MYKLFKDITCGAFESWVGTYLAQELGLLSDT